MSRPPCRFFNKPGGCHRGNQCTFAHTTPPSRRSSDAVNSSASSSQVNTPPGACRLYWTSGTCRHEFKCRFNHVSPDSPPVAPPSRRFTLPDDSVADQVAPFLTKDGLVKLLGSGGTDSYFANPAKPLSPNQAHTAIKRFLYDDFRFRKNTDVYAFMLPINSASSHNDLWSLEDGQLFFAALASGNGLLRIDDVLRYEPVAIAPSGTETLSFHRGFLPLLRFLSSDFVTKSTLNHLINALYSGVLANIGKIHETIVKCFTEALEAGSFNDPGHRTAPVPVGHQVIATLTAILFECLTRFKNATVNFPNLAVLVRDLQRFSADWIARVTSTPPTVKDTLCDPEVSVSTRRHVIAQFHSKLDRLVAIVDGEEGRIKPARQMTNSAFRADSNEGLLAALHESFEGPGTLRSAGPRHDNDFIDIRDIRIAPTDEELKSKFPPYLPANIYGAPHPHPESSMQRLLDIQFRLLREELTAPIRLAVQLVSDDLQQGPRAVTPLSQLLRKGGGKYRSTGPEGSMFNVYTDIEFLGLHPDRRGLSTAFSFTAPPGRARADNAQTRAAFWEGMSGKRMMQGGLVALVWKRGAHIQTHLGLLSSSSKDIASSAKQSPDTVSARVVFFDPEVELHILDTFKHRSYDPDEVKLFVEATVMYEAIRPFLEALCVVPETLPFSRYLPHFPPDSFKTVKIEPPKYATAPGFRFQLASLFDPDADVDDFVMNASSPASTNAARLALRRSRLDPSQAESVVDSLTREVSLIQGPPGTGKSFTGVELLRVLLDNNVGPILLIAFTNHALDHMLCSVLDAGFTSKIVRLGSRSADERISQYSLETKEFAATTSRLTKAFDTQRRELRSVEDKVKELTKKIVKTTISQDDLIEYLMVYHPGHFEILHHPPHWVQLVKTFQDHQTNGWQQVGKNGRTMAEAEDSSWYAFWRSSRDLEFLQADPLSALTKSQPQPSHDASNVASITNSFSALDVSPGEDVSDDEDESPSSSSLVSPEELWMYLMDDNDEASSPPETDASHSAPAPAPVIHRAGSPTSSFHVTDLYDPVLFFDTLGTAQPDIPMTDRPLIALLDEDDVWCMSTIERQRISAFWEEELRRISHEIYISDFKSLRKEHATLLSEYSEGQTEVRRQLLQSVDIVGCTTTGAAKLTSLLKSLEPRVMMVEEAGQVLEAHILGTLVPSIEHLILIGDPLQLRPTLNNYSLSMDSRRGSRLFRFDMSLMERLARAGLPMSRINEQRRMRPAISNLIRRTLYPTLEDHPLVLDHPPVRGLSKSIYFLNHNHRENSQGDESASKYNTYEVAMIRDFVLYLLRQGCYSHDGDIVVLCAYLGQLARVRDALSKDVTVAIDERDQEKLDATEEEKSADGILDPPTDIEVIGVTKVVRLRTVDNYQGEEAKVVILSLVRNSGNIGGDDDDEDWVRSVRPSIGFLKSNNRTNVALSRAREGLYILGNAPLLSAKSPMWNDVLDELATQDAVGPGLPIACSRHPEYSEMIQEPGQLSRVAPDGGCLQACDFGLDCGHLCPYKCHPDDPKHLTVECMQLCRRLCSKGHPCDKRCSQSCGDCRFLIAHVELPCSHICQYVACYLMDNLSAVVCKELVDKQLQCGHTARMACSDDPARVLCKVICGGVMTCCGHACKAMCYQCRDIDGHFSHPCEKPLYCAHRCAEPCSVNHEHTSFCKEPCRQECPHTKCSKSCSSMCSPCQEPCTWRCDHHTCSVPCGSMCTRLPCNLRCTKNLTCGHRCPSVCGEDCTIQICNICAPESRLSQVVDLILYRTLGDIDPDMNAVDELTITLPKCRHVFTVETLDGHTGLGDYYTSDEAGNWVSLKSPEGSNPISPPVCPTCRTAITSPRYGRVFKRADLDILERNVIADMTQSLSKLQEALDRIDKEAIIQSIKNAVKEGFSCSSSTATTEQVKDQAKQRRKILSDGDDNILPEFALNPSTSRFHNVPSEIATLWKQQTSRLNTAYRQLRSITNTRSAHMRAWEAAFSFLYQQEMELVMSDPSHAPQDPTIHAMRMARLKVGQPQPRADKRFVVEAIWVSLRVRFSLIEIGRVLNEHLSSMYPLKERQRWALFIQFLLQSCARDARNALEIARDSDSRRQIIASILFILRIDFDMFTFNVEMSKQVPAEWQHRRDDMIDKAERKVSEVEERISIALSEIPPQESMDDLRETFSSRASGILDEWKSFTTCLRDGNVYLPLSRDEQVEIVRALNFSHTGHFYNCPNGHTFVITECGGAMQRATCPECGSPIGGSDHTLDASNTRATEYEDILRNQGGQASPFAWGR